MDYKQENKKLANDFLERFYYDNFRKFSDNNQTKRYLEIFLLGQCKANCEYCYLKKNQKFLYPAEISNHETILLNLEKTLNWYIENKFICNIEIFSAEWITTPIMEKVFNLLYNKFSTTDIKPNIISLADNMLFINYPEIVNKIENYITKFEQDLNIKLVFSASVDGKYCDFGRTENNDDFYEKVFKFILNHNYGFHPMISPTNVSHWIDNYLWFEQYLTPNQMLDIMTLEVRNVGWDQESIGHLIRFCDFLTDKIYNYFNKDIDKMFDYVFGIKSTYLNYSTIRLKPSDATRVSCRKQNNLCIRMGDLSVAPCHRLFYPQLIAGHFETNESTLLDFEPENLANYIVSRKMKRNNLPYCEECEWSIFCPGHCHGASYEHCGNEYVPTMGICDLYKAKYAFLLYKYNYLGLFTEKNMSKLNQTTAKNILILANNTLSAFYGGSNNNE